MPKTMAARGLAVAAEEKRVAAKGCSDPFPSCTARCVGDGWRFSDSRRGLRVTFCCAHRSPNPAPSLHRGTRTPWSGWSVGSGRLADRNGRCRLLTRLCRLKGQTQVIAAVGLAGHLALAAKVEICLSRIAYRPAAVARLEGGDGLALFGPLYPFDTSYAPRSAAKLLSIGVEIALKIVRKV